jgi:hypothetical protein
MTCRKTLAALVFGICATPLCAADVNSNAIERLRALPRLTVPHYFSLTAEHLRPENYEYVKALVEVFGAVGVGHSNISAAPALAKRLHEETGCKVAMFIVNGVNPTFDGRPPLFDPRSLDWMEPQREQLKAHADLGVPVDFVFFHYEGKNATQGRVWLWHELIRERFPPPPIGPPIGWYHHPQWTMAWSGSTRSGVYEGLSMRDVADVGVFNAYGTTADHNMQCRKKTAELYGAEIGLGVDEDGNQIPGPVCPVISLSFAYGGSERVGRLPRWGSDRRLWMSRADTWLTARHYAVMAARGQIPMVVIWRPPMAPYRRRDVVNDTTKIDRIADWCAGWHNLPLEDRSQPKTPTQEPQR